MNKYVFAGVMIFVAFAALAAGGAAAFFFDGLWGGGETVSFPDIPEYRASGIFIPPEDAPSSHVSVPVELSLDDLSSLVNSSTPRRYDGETEFLDGTVKGKLKYEARRSGDVSVAAVDGALKLTLPIDFTVAFSGSVLAAIVRVPFSTHTDGALNVHITLTPALRRDWSLKTGAEVKIEWIRPPKLNVAGISIGLKKESTKFLSQTIRDRLPELEDKLNEKIALRERVQREWDNLAVPFRIAEAAALHVDPRGISAAPLDILHDRVRLRVSVEAGLTLSLNSEEEAVMTPARRKKLPALGEVVSDDGVVKLTAKAMLSYDRLEREAMNALSKLKIDMGVAELEFKSVRLMGDGGFVAAAVEAAAGSLGGMLYVKGRPVFDETTRVLSIEDFDFTPDAKDALSRNAMWLMRPVLLDSLREKLRWELGRQIDDLTDNARNAVTMRALGDELRLDGSIDSAAFCALRVTSVGLEIGMNILGKARLIYTPE